MLHSGARPLWRAAVVADAKGPKMNTRYLFFYTAKAAIFQFYAFVFLLLSLLYIKLTLNIPQITIVVGTMLYVAIVVGWAFHIDRTNMGNRGV